MFIFVVAQCFFFKSFKLFFMFLDNFDILILKKFKNKKNIILIYFKIQPLL
jgi:hypothetical protein